MGDTFQTIADRDAGPRDGLRLAERVVEWLVAEGIVLATAKTGWALGDDPAHPPGPHWDKAVTHARWGSPEGLVVYSTRSVFYGNSGGGEPFVTCPRCAAVTGDTSFLSPAMESWYRTGKACPACPACGEAVSLPEWNWSDDHLAFAHLGFRFWNWPRLDDAFRTRMTRLLDGHRTVYLAGKL
ncbi:hypothetical protein [Streptomyces sp. NBC_00199]|uniref:hypothetical protein n=1 Tax=Streptomyces sp. NBC_00199 TaxID=2975678 RepID=UPI002257BAD7|nr:hypothetical protein [Streptomyces sp. NBC_00199]MCX5262436.1 hypothetical protein [Streptomyces sp. NBC_00199]